MNEYEYRIPLFGPNYSNSRIVRIIRSNTDTDLGSPGKLQGFNTGVVLFNLECLRESKFEKIHLQPQKVNKILI